MRSNPEISAGRRDAAAYPVGGEATFHGNLDLSLCVIVGGEEVSADKDPNPADNLVEDEFVEPDRRNGRKPKHFYQNQL